MPVTYTLLWLVLAVATVAYGGLLLRRRRDLLSWASLGGRALLLAALLMLVEAASATFAPPPQPLYVLVDSSASVRQTLNLPKGPLDRWETLLPAAFQDVLDQQFPDHQPYYFDLLEAESSSEQSPLQEALGRLIRQGGIPEGSELLLISDGNDTSTTELPTALAQEVKEAGWVLDAWYPQPARSNETWLGEVANPRVAFVNQSTRMVVQVHSDLETAGMSSLILMDGQSVLTQRSLQLPQGPHQEQVELEWTPTRTGEALLSLRLIPLGEEPNVHDNLAYLPLTVRTARLKVLHIAGRPGWDVLHLRRLLKTLPELDLIAFFILRDPFEDAQNVPEGELALIQFPVRELFLRELFKMDTVIFQNFDIKKYLRNPEFQRAFQRYLAGGGRIIAMGGEQSSGQGYQELFLTADERLELQPVHESQWQFAESTLLPPDYLRQQTGFQQLQVAKDASAVLRRTPFRLGRVDWVEDPISWRWRYEPANAVTDHRYALFWQSLLYQPLHERQRMFWALQSLRPRHRSESIEGLLHLPTHSDTVQLTVTEHQLGQKVYEEALAVSNQTTYIRLSDLQPGQYELNLSCGCSDMRDATLPLVVVGDWLEAHDLRRNDAWLNALTQQTGGRLFSE